MDVGINLVKEMELKSKANKQGVINARMQVRGEVKQSCNGN